MKSLLLKLTLPFLLTLLYSLGMARCTHIKEMLGIEYIPPTIVLQNIEIKTVSLESISFFAILEIQNPNRFSIKCQRLNYELVSAKELLAHGLNETPIAIKAEGRSTLKMPVTLNIQSLLGLAKKIASKEKDTKILLKAVGEFDTPIGQQELTFEDEIPLSKILK